MPDMDIIAAAFTWGLAISAFAAGVLLPWVIGSMLFHLVTGRWP